MNKKTQVYFLLFLLFVIGLSLLMVVEGYGQTITKVYAKNGLSNQRIRIDGYEKGAKKPCYVFFPGGGFVTQNWAIDNKWSVMSVSEGYVSCRVGYPTALAWPTLSAANKGIDFSVLAVLWVIAHADEYGIDTNRIILCGTSAGGICALGVAYQHQINVAGVLNAWGAILNLTYLSQNNVPVFNTSTEYDPTVPIGCGKAFSIPCCGSQAITDELIELGIKTDWLPFEGQKHGVKLDADLKKIFDEAQLFFNER